ncbi:hypothetical protein, partial [Yersinia mollaretii]|uniref:hypothetical protein n=1 Tax=Yersinia mollaretii TaxID=33060 RepID=UPI000ACED86A
SERRSHVNRINHLNDYQPKPDPVWSGLVYSNNRTNHLNDYQPKLDPVWSGLVWSAPTTEPKPDPIRSNNRNPIQFIPHPDNKTVTSITRECFFLVNSWLVCGFLITIMSENEH